MINSDTKVIYASRTVTNILKEIERRYSFDKRVVNHETFMQAQSFRELKLELNKEKLLGPKDNNFIVEFKNWPRLNSVEKIKVVRETKEIEICKDNTKKDFEKLPDKFKTSIVYDQSTNKTFLRMTYEHTEKTTEKVTESDEEYCFRILEERKQSQDRIKSRRRR